MMILAKLWAYLKHGPEKVREWEEKQKRGRPMKRPQQRVRKRRR
jgi:hypothetical protein